MYGLAVRHLGRQVGADHLRGLPDARQQPRRIGVHTGHTGAHRAAVAQVPGQRPGVHAADAHHALGRQPVLQLAGGAPVGADPGRVAHHVAGDPHPARLVVLAVDAGVADVRRGLHDDLAVVRRVGQRLLVAGHAGVEDRLAERLPHAAVRLAAEGAPVLQHQQRRRAPHFTAFPSSTVGSPRRNVATTRPGSVRPAYGVLRLRLALSAGSTTQRAAGSTSVKLAGAPGAGSCPCSVEPGDPRRRAGHPLGDEVPPRAEHVEHDRQRRLQPEHARPGVRPLALLVLHGVRRVVGRDHVDAPRRRAPAAARRRRRPYAAAG